ncbi:ABC transporter ATP-binding protein, partial [Brevundimonas sp.]|uniref:ABC transporter ATP-binding protein n=1 Tax=Brevundimonas sp. TaxID=1871086 RepID=UPI002FC5FF17
MSDHAVLRLSNARRSYNGRVAVSDASLTLKAGRITALLGPSGSGKSTILRMIAGLEPLDGGSLHAGETLLADTRSSVPPEHRDIGLVFQDYALFPHLSVADNVAFGLKGSKKDRRAQAIEWLAHVKLADRADSWPHMLSGGEQQRVALVRALARKPRAILLDEPFSGLDRHLKSEVRRSLIDTLRASGTAVLIVTHDAEEALMMADDLVLMDKGVILQTGSPQDCYQRPSSIAAARLLGEAEVLKARIKDGIATTAFGSSPCDLVNGEGWLMARPETIQVMAAVEGSVVTNIVFGGTFY